MYYSHRCLCCNSLYINALCSLYMTPKGSQALCFDDWRASWTHLGHTLDTPCSLGNRLIPPFHPPFGRLDHEPCNGKYTPYFARKCRFSSAVNVTKKSQIPLSGLQCKKSDFLNTFSGLTPVFFETKGKIRGKYEQSKDIKMYARKSGFVTKITKNDDKSYDTERAKVRKNALKVGKLRKKHKNTPCTLSNCAQSTHTHKHKKPLQ